MGLVLTFRSNVHDSVPITANERPVLLINGSCSGWAAYSTVDVLCILHALRRVGTSMTYHSILQL